MAEKTVAPSTTGAEDAPFSPEQYQSILEVIAGRANTLKGILMMSSQAENGWEEEILKDAAEVIATSIGIMADEGSGRGIIGDANRWNYGPNFSRSVEAQHG